MNINEHIDSLNNSMDNLQKEADFFLVIHLFNNLKKFQTDYVGKNVEDNSIILLCDHNRKLSVAFDGVSEDVGRLFENLTQQDILDLRLKKGWENVHRYIVFKDKEVPIAPDLELDDFVKNHTTEKFKTRYLAYTLDSSLAQKPPVKKKKL